VEKGVREVKNGSSPFGVQPQSPRGNQTGSGAG
jgi:hypothetical protein